MNPNQNLKPSSSKFKSLTIVIVFIAAVVYLATDGLSKAPYTSYYRPQTGRTDIYLLGIQLTAFRVFILLPVMMFSLYAYWKLIETEGTVNNTVVIWGVLFWVIPI